VILALTAVTAGVTAMLVFTLRAFDDGFAAARFDREDESVWWPVDDAYAAWFGAHSRCTQALRAWTTAAPGTRATAYRAYLAELELEEKAAAELERFAPIASRDQALANCTRRLRSSTVRWFPWLRNEPRTTPASRSRATSIR